MRPHLPLSVTVNTGTKDRDRCSRYRLWQAFRDLDQGKLDRRRNVTTKKPARLVQGKSANPATTHVGYQEILLSASMIANPVTPAANAKHKTIPNAMKQRLAHMTSTTRT